MHKIGNKGTFYSGEKGTKKIGVDNEKAVLRKFTTEYRRQWTVKTSYKGYYQFLSVMQTLTIYSVQGVVGVVSEREIAQNFPQFLLHLL